MGHIERCKSIRSFLNYRVVWILSKEYTGLEKIFLNDEYSYYTEVPNSINKWKAFIECHNINFLLVDSYYVSIYLLNKLTTLVKVGTICDKKPFPTVNLTIVPHPIITNKKNIFSGYKYSIVSSKILNTKKYKTHIKRNNKRNILISFGALDTANITKKIILNIINKKELFQKNYIFTIILGKNAPHIQMIKEIIFNYKFIKLRVQPINIQSIILKADLAIGAPGISQIERMYLGVPSILIPQNKIQEPLILYWKKHKLALDSKDNINCVVDKILKTSDKELSTIKQNCLRLIDSSGAKRVANLIKKYVT